MDLSKRLFGGGGSLTGFDSPDIQELLVARGFDGDISFPRYAVQSGAKVLHLLAIQAAERNPDRLLGVQFRKIVQDILHRLSMLSFTTLGDIGLIHCRIVGGGYASISIMSHGKPSCVPYRTRKIVRQRIVTDRK